MKISIKNFRAVFFACNNNNNQINSIKSTLLKSKVNGTTGKKLEKLNIYCKIDQSTTRRAVFAEHWKSIQFAYTKIILYEKWTFGYLANTKKKRNKIKLKQHLLCTSKTVYAQQKHSRASFKVFFYERNQMKTFLIADSHPFARHCVLDCCVRCLFLVQ